MSALREHCLLLLLVINNYLELESVWKAFYSWNPILLCQQPLIIRSSCIQLQLFFINSLDTLKIHRMPHSYNISSLKPQETFNILAAILICIPARYKKKFLFVTIVVNWALQFTVYHDVDTVLWFRYAGFTS